MIILQHTALSILAIYRKVDGDTKAFNTKLRDEIPWILLPDAIRFYTKGRQASHFEQPLTGDTAWMIFPDEDAIWHLSEDNVSCHMPKEGTFKPCAIGEDIDINKFDEKNYGHKHYHSLRMHLVQDIALDEMLRGPMVNTVGRFNDEFIVKTTNHKMNGQELRQQIGLFEHLGFIHLLGKLYEGTGILLDKSWFECGGYVLGPIGSALQCTYPTEMANNTLKYMQISDELQERIMNMRFELTKEERDSVYITKDLIETLDRMYSRAYRETFAEM